MERATYIGSSSISSGKALEMNQNLKFNQLRFGNTNLLLGRLHSSLALTMLIFAMGLPGISSAQPYVAPMSYPASSDSSQWTQPNTAAPGVYRASSEQDELSANVSFPEFAAPFDPGIRSTKLELPATDLTNDVGTGTSFNSTTGLLASWKVFASEKFTSLIGAANQHSWGQQIQNFIGSSDIGRMLGSLSLVLGIYFAFVWVMRKINPTSNQALPHEIVEVMGQIPFGPRRNLQLVRLGNKLLLLLNSADGVQPIGEITDPNEVEHFTSLYSGKAKNSRTIRPATHNTSQIAAPRTNTPPPQTPDPQPTNNSNLAEILRSLERVAKQGGAVFEA